MKMIAYSMWVLGSLLLAMYARGEIGVVFLANCILIFGGHVFAAAKAQEGK